MSTFDQHFNWLSVLTLSTQLMFMPFAIWIIAQFIYKYVSSTIRFPKKLFFSGLIFFILTLLAIVGLFIDLLLGKLKGVGMGALILFLYGFSMFFLNLIIFFRLLFVFNSNMALFAISKCTKFYYFCFFALQIFFIFMVPVLLWFNGPTGVLAPSIGLILISIVLNMSLAVLFLFKLHRINKFKGLNKTKHDESSADFIDHITKNCIITITALMSSLITICSFTMASGLIKKSEGGEVMAWTFSILCISIDCYTNFASIVFTFNYFATYYYALCGPLDRGCKVCCISNYYGRKASVKREMAVKIETTSGGMRDEGTMGTKEITVTVTNEVAMMDTPKTPFLDAAMNTDFGVVMAEVGDVVGGSQEVQV